MDNFIFVEVQRRNQNASASDTFCALNKVTGNTNDRNWKYYEIGTLKD